MMFGPPAARISECSGGLGTAASGGGGGGSGGGAVTESAAKRQKTDDGSVVGLVVDNDDGTYRCTYTPPAAAAGRWPQWQLTIQIRGMHIAGSPFALEVVNGKEFTFDHITQGGLRQAASFDGNGALYGARLLKDTCPYSSCTVPSPACSFVSIDSLR
jgi:hypothetical protein